MAKKSKRRQAQQNKDHAGCMWGLINIFDFHHGRTTKRLLSDKRIVTKNNIVSEYPTSEVNMLTSSEERHASIEDITEIENSTIDVVKTSVKELMEEELVNEQDSTKPTNDDVDKRSSKNSINDHEISNNLEALMKEILMIYQKKNDRHSDNDASKNRNFSIVEEKLSAAIEVFMNEKTSNQHSKDFIDTFQMLSSNKELFLKLLQDQASLNPNELQKSKSTDKSNPLENDPTNRKHKNFFRRRSKSHESMQLSRIFILKPNSPDNRIKIENDIHSERISSNFSFMEIKKRFKNAMQKEQKLGGNEETVVEGNSGWSSPNRDHFYTERFTKKIERVSKLKESEIKQRENEENGDTSRHISNIYIEAKKHLSEMLSGDADLMMENLPETLGNILSFEEYNTFSPGNFHSVNESQPCVASVDLEEKPKVLDEVNPEGIVEIEKPENQEEMEVLDVFCEPCSSSESIYDEQNGEIVEVFDEETSPKCLKSDLPEENEFSSPIWSSRSNKIEEPDRNGRPSPVSVLDPLFSDNEISPQTTNYRHVESAIQPLCIQFNDQEIHTRNHTENEESAFEYVESLLLASDLNWDEFEKKWISSIQILDQSLFNEVEIFSNQPSYDQRLLFDSTNEILLDVCDCYLDFFLQLSLTNGKIQPVPKGENLINEIWERIKLQLKSNYPLSLDHIVKKDLGISRTWMDLRSDYKQLVFEIDESIFEDMMDDILSSLINDRVGNKLNEE